MTPESANLNLPKASTTLSFAASPTKTAHRLSDAEKAEALSFLKERSLHTFVMSGYIRDNGLESEFNRGVFYGHRDAAGALQGVALIGHAIYLEIRSNTALREFARTAQLSPQTHMIMGESEIVERFWSYYAAAGQPERRLGREVLFELNERPKNYAPVPGLRPADLNDFSLIVPIHAALAFEESGVNPLAKDPRGFRERCRRRIEQGRIWVLVEHGELLFKADIVSDTPEVIYLEGLYVRPNERRKGYGSRCLAQMALELLSGTKSITALVNEEKLDAQTFLRKIGFEPRALYDTIFLREDRNKPKPVA